MKSQFKLVWIPSGLLRDMLEVVVMRVMLEVVLVLVEVMVVEVYKTIQTFSRFIES